MNFKKLLKESVWVYAFVFITAFAGYFIRILYAHNLSVAEYGLFYAVLGFIFLFGSLREFGFNSSQLFYMNEFIAEKEYSKAKGVFHISLVSQVILSILITIIIFTIKPYLVTHFFKSESAGIIIDILLGMFIVQVFFRSISSVFGSFQKHLLYQLKDFLPIIFTLIFSLLFFFLGFKLLTAPISNFLGGLLVLLIYIFLYNTQLKEMKVKAYYDKDIRNRVLKYAFVIGLGSSTTGLFLPYIDTVMLTWMKGVESVAYYNVVQPSMRIILILTFPLFNILSPIVMNLFHKKKIRELSAIATFVYNNFLILTLPIAIILFVFSKEIIILIFGAKYIQASLALKVYVLFSIFLFLRIFNFTFLGSIGEVAHISKVLWIGAGANVILNLILIYFFDYTGAVVATGLSFILMSYLTTTYLNKKIKINIDYMQQFKIIGAGAIFLLVAALLENYLHFPWKFGILLEGLVVLAASSIVYLSLLVAFRVVTKEKINFLIKMFKQNPSY